MRRRFWASAQKLRIVQETLEPRGSGDAGGAALRDTTCLLYTWRKQALAGALAGFLPVRIVPDEVPSLPAPQPEDDAPAPASHHSLPRRVVRLG